MKTQSSLTLLFLLSLLVTTSQGDDIHFKNGQLIKGKVLDFKDGKITIRKEDGKTVSGEMSVPIRQAWTRNEYLYPGESGARTIKLDPGPPYENLEFEVELTAGEVTNLGRIMLKKVEATGTANISGIVKDMEGNPVPDAIVTAGRKKTKSGTNGEYTLEGFGLGLFCHNRWESRITVLKGGEDHCLLTHFLTWIYKMDRMNPNRN